MLAAFGMACESTNGAHVVRDDGNSTTPERARAIDANGDAERAVTDRRQWAALRELSPDQLPPAPRIRPIDLPMTTPQLGSGKSSSTIRHFPAHCSTPTTTAGAGHAWANRASRVRGMPRSG
jgi:hypothetical protein